jgi:3-oxoacyl-[acyl-carrier protein] reductase
MRLAGRVAIVTGAGQGIGRTYAQRLVAEGAGVVVAELNETTGKAVTEGLAAGGGRALFVRTDVADEASCREMAAATVRQFGRIDVLVNNAAVFSTIRMKPFWELSVAEWDELMAVNARGVWLASKAVVPQMQAQRAGRIINMSAGVVFNGRPHYLHYVASKGAVLSMTRAMARELGDFGITVNCITPGATYTEVPRETVTHDQKAAITRMLCLKRPEEPADLAGTVVFLASDDAAFITGQTINVDGGLNFH